MYKLKVGLTVGIFFIIFMAVISQRHTIGCEMITPSGFTEIDSKIIASPLINDVQRTELVSYINSAKLRINETFGDVISSPKIIIAATESEALGLGANMHGATFLSPLGQCIVLGPKGQNVDVIAHEYTHAEVHYRVGWLNYLLNVPTWFNEGIATLVDFRKHYLLENIDLTQREVNSIKKQTFDHSQIKHYQAVRVLVSDINKSKLYENLDKIKQGQDINSVFAL